MSRREGGFTLVELMVAITIGLVTTAGAVSLLTNAMRRSDESQRRAETTLRAQTAVDAITKDLRSQVCLRPAAAAPQTPVIAATPTSVTFYLSFARDGSVERRQLELDGAGVLRERIWASPDGTGTMRTRTLATDLAGGFAGNGVFAFYGYTSASGTADTALATPLTATTLPQVARIAVSLKAQPRGTKDGTRETPITDDVFVRLLDPDGGPAPECA